MLLLLTLAWSPPSAELDATGEPSQDLFERMITGSDSSQADSHWKCGSETCHDGDACCYERECCRPCASAEECCQCGRCIFFPNVPCCEAPDGYCGQDYTCVYNRFCAPPQSIICEGHVPPYCDPSQTCLLRNICAPAGSDVCDNHDPPYCDPGQTCVHNKFCAPAGGDVCDNHDPPYCDPGQTCVHNKFCAPAGGDVCDAHDPPYCEPGETCVHSTYCMPPGYHICDGARPIPYCAPSEECLDGHVCAPTGATWCYNSTFPNGTFTPNFCAPNWVCNHAGVGAVSRTASPDAPASDATCELRNVCSANTTLSNVCAACSKDYITTQEDCDDCVAARCTYCDPMGPRGCFHACDACCAPFVDECDACVKEECGHNEPHMAWDTKAALFTGTA